jgi:hypothetical protein
MLMVALEVVTQPCEDADMALVRAAASLMANIREDMGLSPIPLDLRRPAEELPAGECVVRVCGENYGYAGLDSKGRMVLYAEGIRDPFFYGPTVGERFVWRPLIGDFG